MAVLAVLVFHATDSISGGFVGVDIFFVISGYVITMMLAREFERHGRIRFGNFYLRRFKRLSPALGLVLAFTLIGAALTLSPYGSQEVVVATATGAVLLVANLVIMRTTGGYFDAAAEQNPLLHTWSLAVEEQFYLAFPALLAFSWMAARRVGGRRVVPLLIVGTVGLLSFLLALSGSAGHSSTLIPESLVGFYGPAPRVWEFAAGALLALAGPRLVLVSQVKAMLLGVLGVFLTVASLFLINAATPFPGQWTLLPVVGTSCLIIAGTQPQNSVSRALATRPMVLIGDLSYSLYLWHWPFIVFATLLWPDADFAPVLAALASAIPAYLSYRFFEEPIRATPLSRMGLLILTLATLAVPLLLAGAVRVAVANGYWNDTVRKYQAAITTPHLSAEAGCTSRAWEKSTACTWNDQGTQPPIYLVGDSNADHLSEAILRVGEADGRPVVVSAQVGCTFADINLTHPKPDVVELCNSYVAGAHSQLVNADPGVVVIANAYRWWVPESDIQISVGQEAPAQNDAERLEVLERGLSASIERLQSAGHRVVIVQVIPLWGDGPEALSWAACSVSDTVLDSCRRSFTLGDARERQAPIWAALGKATRQSEAELIDLAPALCPGDVCESVTDDGLIRYRDGTHITVEQSVALFPALSDLLGDVE